MIKLQSSTGAPVQGLELDMGEVKLIRGPQGDKGDKGDKGDTGADGRDAGVSSASGVLLASGWSDGSQSLAVSAVSATNTVLIAPEPVSQAAYSAGWVLCTAQAAGALTFSCESAPTEDLTVNIVILEE